MRHLWALHPFSARSALHSCAASLLSVSNLLTRLSDRPFVQPSTLLFRPLSTFSLSVSCIPPARLKTAEDALRLSSSFSDFSSLSADTSGIPSDLTMALRGDLLTAFRGGDSTSQLDEQRIQTAVDALFHVYKEIIKQAAKDEPKNKKKKQVVENSDEDEENDTSAPSSSSSSSSSSSAAASSGSTRACRLIASTWLSDNLPTVLRRVDAPHSFVLSLLEDSRILASRTKHHVDLPLILLKSLQIVKKKWITPSSSTNSDSTSAGSMAPAIAEDLDDLEEDVEEEDSALAKAAAAASSSAATTAKTGFLATCDEVTPSLQQRAHTLCVNVVLSTRAIELCVQLYNLALTTAELIQCAQLLMSQKQYRHAADFLRIFRVETNAFPHESLIEYLVATKSNVDALVSYLQMSPAFSATYSGQAIMRIAEGMAYHANPILAKVKGDPNLASKILCKLGRRLEEFPRIVYLKKKDVIWWICKIGKTEDFVDILLRKSDTSYTDNELKLQSKICSELLKSKNTHDLQLAYKYIKQWQLTRYEKKFDSFIQSMDELKANNQVANDPPPTWMLQLNQLYLSKGLPDIFSLPGSVYSEYVASTLPPASSSSSSSSSTLSPSLPPATPFPNSPCLFTSVAQASTRGLPVLMLDPQSIIVVNDSKSLEFAWKELLGWKENNSSDNGDDDDDDDGADVDLFGGSSAPNAFASDVKYVGVDLEHLPENFKDLDVCEYLPQTLQISTRQYNFIFDLQVLSPLIPPGTERNRIVFEHKPSVNGASLSQALANPQHDAALSKRMQDLLMCFFCNEDIFKVGIGFSSDYAKLRQAFPSLACFSTTVQSYIDVTPALKQLPQDEPPPANNDTAKYGRGYTKKGEGGLAKLTRQCLKGYLTKEQQISNWAKRPLHPLQLQYAALDAQVLLPIYDYLTSQNIQLDGENIDATNYDSQ